MTNTLLPYKIIIAALALILVVVSVHSYNHKKAADHFSHHSELYPLLDPALPFYDKENLIVNIQELRDYLNGLPEQNKDRAEMSIYFEVMSTGANASVNNNLRLPPASLSKLPMAMIAMKKVEKGEWSIDTQLTIQKEDVDATSDPRLVQDIGTNLPLKTVIERLLSYSDNTSYHMIVRSLTDNDLISIAEEVGLDDFFTTDGMINAKDYTRFLRVLHSSTFLSKENSQFILDLLVNSKFDKFLRAGIPSGIPLAHKWGIHEQQNVYADAGIVYAKNRPYMISVIIRGKNPDNKSNQEKAEQLIKEIGQKSYEFMTQE